MELNLVSKAYKCNVVLADGAQVSADLVTVQDGKVHNVSTGSVAVKMGDDTRHFTFSIYSEGKVYNVNNAPAEVDCRAIILEFIAAVEAELEQPSRA